MLQNLLVDGCIDFRFDKTQWTNTRKRHGTPNHHWLWKLQTGLQAALILCLSTLPPDSGTLISKWNAKCTFIWKEDFGPLSNSPVLFLFSPGKMLLMMFLFQKWLGSSGGARGGRCHPFSHPAQKLQFLSPFSWQEMPLLICGTCIYFLHTYQTGYFSEAHFSARSESNEHGKGALAKWASVEQWDAVRLYVSKTNFPVLSGFLTLMSCKL